MDLLKKPLPRIGLVFACILVGGLFAQELQKDPPPTAETSAAELPSPVQQPAEEETKTDQATPASPAVSPPPAALTPLQIRARIKVHANTPLPQDI